MFSEPVNVRSWSTIHLALVAAALVVGDNANAQMTDKDQCRKACDATAVAESLVGADPDDSQAALVILGCHLSCEIAGKAGAFAETDSLHWNEHFAQAKDCDGLNRIFHIPCTDINGVWAWNNEHCPSFPETFRGQPLAKPYRPIKDPVFGDLRAWLWQEFEAPDPSCTVYWADQRAHRKDCSGASRVYHVRCERADGSWSTDCPDMASRPFLGAAMTSTPRRLEDRAWTEVAISDVTCSVGWADERAHRKDCSGTNRIYHVRCERPDGNWSTDCTDMERRLFRGVKMTADPVRLSDRAWTEVAIADPSCP